MDPADLCCMLETTNELKLDKNPQIWNFRVH